MEKKDFAVELKSLKVMLQRLSLSLSLLSESFSRLTWIHLGDSDRCQDKAAGHSSEIQHTCYCATVFSIFVSLSTKIKVSVSGGVWGGVSVCECGEGRGGTTQKPEEIEFSINISQFHCQLQCSWRCSTHRTPNTSSTPHPHLEATLLVLLDGADCIAESERILWPITTR